MSSMWNVPPAGCRRTSALTTASVSCATSSRTRAEAAPWPPFTARNDLVIATEIFDGSNATTEPFRRMTLYWESSEASSIGRPSGRLPANGLVRAASPASCISISFSLASYRLLGAFAPAARLSHRLLYIVFFLRFGTNSSARIWGLQDFSHHLRSRGRARGLWRRDRSAVLPEERPKAGPIERRTGIGLAVGRDVRVPDDFGDRIAAQERGREGREPFVLNV